MYSNSNFHNKKYQSKYFFEGTPVILDRNVVAYESTKYNRPIIFNK